MALSMVMSFNFHLSFTFMSALILVAFLSDKDSTGGGRGTEVLIEASIASSTDALDFGRADERGSRLPRGSLALRGSTLPLGSPPLSRGSFAAFRGSTLGVFDSVSGGSLEGDLLPFGREDSL